jgi:hypothetical protein
MPVPAFNIINGGSHAGNKLAMQAGWPDRANFRQWCVSFGLFFYYKSRPNFCSTFLHGTNFVLIWTKKGLAVILVESASFAKKIGK